MTTRDMHAEPPEGVGYAEVEPHDLASLGPVRLVDVREPHEYEGELCHIAGAELIPLGELELAARGWDRTGRVVVICRSGRRSAVAAALLARHGFSNVINLRGGMQAYRDAGLPTECGPCPR